MYRRSFSADLPSSDLKKEEICGGESPTRNAKTNAKYNVETFRHPMLNFRSNEKIARAQDIEKSTRDEGFYDFHKVVKTNVFNTRTIRVVELFAGIGGLSLGFLLAKNQKKKVCLVEAAEIDEECVDVLRRNFQYMRANNIISAASVPPRLDSQDLSRPSTRKTLSERVLKDGPIDIVIGGPPCQGFSTANRSDKRFKDPNNNLVYSFLDCIKRINPKLLVMENVQGISWTSGRAQGSKQSALELVIDQLTKMDYVAFPRLLDASWFGVPQRRNRIFIVAIKKEYLRSDDVFQYWGPFPKPTHGPGAQKKFTTVADAISDLPKLKHGSMTRTIPFCQEATGRCTDVEKFIKKGASKTSIGDHTTSTHSTVVMKRIRKIDPGKNWSQIPRLFSDYSNKENAHSNLYRRLEWSKPSVTIGNVRKNVLIHPEQHRTLSVRETARLQTFPDWFRFSDEDENRRQKISHYQQQLANAVCPLLARAIAEFLITL